MFEQILEKKHNAISTDILTAFNKKKVIPKQHIRQNSEGCHATLKKTRLMILEIQVKIRY